MSNFISKYLFAIFSLVLFLLPFVGWYFSKIEYFFEHLSSGYATLVSAWAIIAVYLWQKRDNKIKAAQILLMEIRNAEQTLDELKNNNNLGENKSVLPVNTWVISQHFFVKDLDLDEFNLMNAFYNTCFVIQKQIDRIREIEDNGIDEKVILTQQKLLELGKLIYDSDDYKKEKEKFLYNGFWKEIDTFAPHKPREILGKFVVNVQYITTSSCGAKLKSIAGK